MIVSKDNNFLSGLFLRTPYFSFTGYDFNMLPEVLQQQDFRNAIWLASPGFYDALERAGFLYEKLGDKQKHTLHKYYNRMCFRPTPFGSFASFTLVDWGAGDTIKLSEAKLHLLPDQRLIAGLGPVMAGDGPGRIVVNPCLYRSGDTFRYYRSQVGPDGKYSFSLSAIGADDFNAGLLAGINSSWDTPAVFDWMMERGECSRAEAEEYLQFLIDEQVILTGGTGGLIRKDPFRSPGPQSQAWDGYWDKYRSPCPGGDTDVPAAAADLKEILGRNTSEPRLFYAASERSAASGAPPSGDREKLSEALHLIRLLNTGNENPDLANFRKEFSRRFDQQKVPLLSALDTDAGISYGNLTAPEGNQEHLDDLQFPGERTGGLVQEWGAAHQLLFRLWIGDTQRDPWSPIVLDAVHISELDAKQENAHPLPNTQAVMYRNTGEHLLIEHAGGVTAASLIGRFSVFSTAVQDLCRELASVEVGSNPEVVFADIGQLTNLHVDNINRRRAIYDYELPVNVISELGEDARISPGDLLLSVRGGELVLESARLGMRVIPRLSTAYNFRHNTLPVFRLLCDLQYQGLNAGSVPDLEQFFPGLSFYPRICTANVVLCLAKWRFGREEISSLAAAAISGRLEAMNAFRRRHRLPRYISLGETDQQLAFDLAVNAEVAFFLACIAGMKTVTVQEYFYPDRSVMTGNKPLAGQFIAFSTHGKKVYEGIINSERPFVPQIRRSFMAGSDWLYLKIFCSPRVADQILALVVRPFISDYQAIRQWFFIRYTEQGNHLRLRFHGPENDLALILPELNKRLADAGFDQLIRDYQADTYHREVERYGASMMPEMEELFHIGSNLVTRYLHGVAGWEPGLDAFRFGLLTAKLMFSAFFDDDSVCLRFLRDVRDSFIKEFRAEKPLITGLDQRYRKLKPELEELFQMPVLPEYMEDLLGQVSKLAVLVNRLGSATSFSLAADAVHMQLNRTFNVQQREQELLVYYFLEKYMASLIARNRVSL